MRMLALAVVSLLVVGCKTPAPEQKEPLGPPPVPVKFDPVAYVASYRHPLECESMASRLQGQSRDQAWQALEACVKHGNFLYLRALLSPNWLPDLQNRPDAPALVTDVIAARGGNIDADLQLLHKQRIPLFALAAGLGQPEVYQGRLVLIRGKVNSIRKVHGRLIADVSEVTLQSEQKASRQIGASLEDHSVETDAQQDDSGHWGGEDLREGDEDLRMTVPVYDNTSVDTGREVMLSIAHPDPFFETGGEYLMLVRFDGVRPAGPEDNEPTARATLLHFQRPGSLVVN